MKITCIREKLLNGLKTVGPAIGGKDALNVLTNVKVEAKTSCPAIGAVPDEEFDSVELTATDATFQIKASVPAKVSGNGKICLPGKFLTAFVDALPEGEVEIEVNEAGTKAKVSGGECKYTLSAVSADDFPVMSGPENGDGFCLAANVVKEMLRKVEYAAGNDSARKVLQGVNVCATGKMIRMVATDGKRLSIVEHFFETSGAKDVSLGTLPREVVKELSALLGKMYLGHDVKITTDGKTVRVSAESGEFEITSKLYEDVYPNWIKVVPEKVAFTAKAKREAFLQELLRAEASTLAGDGRNVKLTFEQNRVVMEGAANDISKSRTQMEVEYVGEKAQFIVNPKMLEDVLKSIDDDDFTIGFDGSDQRLVIKCTVPFVAVVMPWRIS